MPCRCPIDVLKMLDRFLQEKQSEFLRDTSAGQPQMPCRCRVDDQPVSLQEKNPHGHLWGIYGASMGHLWMTCRRLVDVQQILFKLI